MPLEDLSHEKKQRFFFGLCRGLYYTLIFEDQDDSSPEAVDWPNVRPRTCRSCFF